MPENEKSTLGAVGAQVVENVKELMAARGLSLRGLSERLEATGRRILPSVLGRLTSGGRRVDADDLLALALALDVSPSALLLPRHVRADDMVELAPNVRHRAAEAWAWMDGRLPLPPPPIPAGTNVVVTPGDRFADYVRHSRPDAAQDQDPFIGELLVLRQMVEDVLSDPDEVARWAEWRDTILRRWRIVGVQLEELTARLDREALTAAGFEFDTAAAIALLQEATGQVRRPIIGAAPGTPGARLAGEGTLTAGTRPGGDPHAARGAATTIPGPGPHAAPTSSVDPLDPFGQRGDR